MIDSLGSIIALPFTTLLKMGSWFSTKIQCQDGSLNCFLYSFYISSNCYIFFPQTFVKGYNFNYTY